MASDPVRVLLHVATLLDRIGTPYFLGGSLASSMLGEPRSSNTTRSALGRAPAPAQIATAPAPEHEPTSFDPVPTPSLPRTAAASATVAQRPSHRARIA